MSKYPVSLFTTTLEFGMKKISMKLETWILLALVAFFLAFVVVPNLVPWLMGNLSNSISETVGGN